ncbi:MAG: PilZ domain-containing protein [Candidatus Omnitrophica bacterium]|nr:PilZ domain-containing protein [Candidatus Omnitrophota bacterium]MCB9747220.1 PilZ domain-containing protein [Candidatus Omnitrophota bacterium]
MDERRFFERFSSRYPARIKDSREEFGARFHLREASAEGVRIRSTEKVFNNDSLTLEVKLPDGHDPMILKGHVVWTKNQDSKVWDIGLKFHKIRLMHLSRLYSLAVK